MPTADGKPLLAVTMGDAAGVGPEVIVRCWADPRIHRLCQPVVLGHPEVLRQAVRLVGSRCRVEEVFEVSQLSAEPLGDERIPCLSVGSDNVLEVPQGTIDGRTGQAAYEAIVRATDDTMAGIFQGVVTAPISKAALHAAGRHYPGHTELLAERCGVDDFAMMLYLPSVQVPSCPAGLGVVHVTLHMALRKVFENLTSDAVLTKCRLAARVMREGFGLAEPRIGVCALNPHAGEDGLFGDEESAVISPAVDQAHSEGMDVSGPFPTDTLMGRARDGEFDAIVAMYHDQGHIALKLLGMHRAVNITLGLPIIRTSVAHGTAFDRAWHGTAEASGMVAAMKTAAQLAAGPLRNKR
ncbi:MAG: 4-hydroxythreonine-4-phosphate dehydrogenase PdxA [Pirellulales bacterium]|nr:4-hydroxythreonine-4-phosphate dehydrogenase PdxA [Pirellulales bacterium]